MPRLRRACLTSLVALMLSWGAADAPTALAEDARHPNQLVGEWWTEGNEGRIEFTRAKDGTFRGITRCCRPKRPSPDSPERDIHNPNPKLRNRSTLGIVIVWNLTYEDGEYADGYIYNPRDGKTYRLDAEFIDRNTLRIRGYLGIPLLGRSQIWKRAQPAQSQSPQRAPARVAKPVER